MSPPLPPDPYKVLGVAKDAQTPTIRSAHRKLILKCHPDKVQDPKLKAEKQDEFQKVQQAYELLIDDNERQKYDDKIKLADLRKQMQDKVNISTPRATRHSSRPDMPSPDLRSFARSSPPPSGKSYSYKQFYDADLGHGIRIETSHVRPSPRRDPSFTYKTSKREVEREREREKDMDRERRRKEDDRRAAEKAEKEARRAVKKHREKVLLKERKRETEEKQRHARPTVIDDFEDDAPRKRSSSKKYDEKRERYDSSREDVSRPPTSRPPMPTRHYSVNPETPLDRAQSYLDASRAKAGGFPGLQRSASYSPRNSNLPSAPTPPPANNKPFAMPSDSDEDIARRSSARPRRGSGDSPRTSRERYAKGPREVLEDHIAASPSPASRHPPKFMNSASATPKMPGSPRFDLRRTETMPVSPDPGHSKPGPMPSISRAQTFGAYGEKPLPRGRDRSRMQAQVAEDSDSEEYDRRRDRKYRSSRKSTHSPEPVRRADSISRYHYEGGGRTRRVDSYPNADPYGHFAGDYSVRMSDARRPSHVRESSYSASPGLSRYADDIVTSKAYSRDDINWSNNYVDRDYRRYPVRV